MNRRGSSVIKIERLALRASFSLVEVLVVMAIMIFLAGAIVAVVPRVQNAAKIASTRATIKKVDELLNDRLNGFRRWLQTQDQIAGQGIPSYVLSQGTLTQFNNNLAFLPLAKILAVKQLYKSNFAQSYSDLPQTITSTNPQGTSHQAVTDSAECLYLFLTKGPLYDTEAPSTGDLRAIETADTDGDGIPEIVDAWGHPLRFYHWPTRLFRPADTPTTAQSVTGTGATAGYGLLVNPRYPTSGANAGLTARLLITSITLSALPAPATFTAEATQLLAKDPDDPLGLLDAASNPSSPQASSSNASTFEQIQNYHTPDTYYTTLIVSMGPDEQLGLFEPYDSANFGYLGQPRTDLPLTDPAGLNALVDNITNHQQ